MTKADIYQFIAEQKLGVLGDRFLRWQPAVGPRGNRRESRIGDYLRYRQEFAQVPESGVECRLSVRGWVDRRNHDAVRCYSGESRFD
jgi:hypothetical protein